MKKTLLATTAFTFVVAAQAASAVDVQLYGQVNKSLYAFDDGKSTETVVVDNAMSTTRFGFKGAQALSNGLTASVLFEGEQASNPSNAFTQNTAAGFSPTPTNSASPSFTERQARVGVTGNFGSVYLGQQSTAIDGVLLQDLAGANDVMSANLETIGGGLYFRNSNAAAATNGTVGTVGENLAAIGTKRDDSIRYDSPVFSGAQGRLSLAQGGDLEASALYSADYKNTPYGGFAVKAAAGVEFNNDQSALNTTKDVNDKRYAASMSVKHSSGLAGTVAYTQNSLTNKTAGAKEPKQWYAKVGYAWDAFEVAADYAQAKHYKSKTVAKDELTAMGLAAQYKLADGVTAAALYRNFDAEYTGQNTDSVNLYGVNLRVTF